MIEHTPKKGNHNPTWSDQAEQTEMTSYVLHGQTIVDPFIYLERSDHPATVVFVERQNQRTEEYLVGEFRDELTEKLTRRNQPDDIQMPAIGRQLAIKFKATPDQPKGTLFVTGRDNFLNHGSNTAYDLLLDVGVLAQKEGRDWFFFGLTHQPRIGSRCLLSLSDGGGDAVLVREFNLESKAIIEDGFQMEGLVRAAYYSDTNDILFAAPGRPDNTSKSGYPLEVCYLPEGENPSNAKVIFKANSAHMSVSFFRIEIRRDQYRHIITDTIDFYHADYYFLKPDTLEPLKLPLPKQCTILEVAEGKLFFSPIESYKISGKEYLGGLVAIDLDAFINSSEKAVAGVWSPGEGQALESAFCHEGKLFIHFCDNIVSRVLRSEESVPSTLAPSRKQIAFEEIALPGKGAVSAAYSIRDVGICFNYQDFITPPSFYLIDRDAPSLETAFMKEEDRFESSNVAVDQQWASSADGTRIPFFVLDARADKTNTAPTILNGYGGFQISLRPRYNWRIGAAWLEKGGVFVIANIRGGGEFGPEWHQAALKNRRHKAYEDFAAVADRLVELGVALPEQIGALGSSNGGLLTANMLTTYPEKFGAIVSSVPLIDMLRYDQLSRGDSWVGEYGSPQIPEDFEFLKRYSAYHNISQDVVYPPVLFATSATDDRVHPGHARKMAALMQSLNIGDVYFFEKTEGGHGSSDFNSWIPSFVRDMSFFADKLGLHRIPK